MSTSISNEHMTAERKSLTEAEIKKNLQTLASPDRLLGADPKEVSAFTSRFKELLETISKIKPIEPTVSSEKPESTDAPADEGAPPPDAQPAEVEDEEDTGFEDDCSEGDQDPESDSDAETPDTEGTASVLAVVQTVLTEEFGDVEGERLTQLIALRLDSQMP